MNTPTEPGHSDEMKLKDAFMRYSLARAELGNSEQAGKICKGLANWIENDQPIPPSARKYLIEALREVGEKASCGKKPQADRAFLLRPRRGRRWWLENETRNLKMAMNMDDYLRENKDRSQEDAAEYARKKLRAEDIDVRGVSDKAARKIYRFYTTRLRLSLRLIPVDR